MQNHVSPCRGQNKEQGSRVIYGKEKITGPKDNAISFKICRAKKYEVHERLERKLRPVSRKKRYQPLRGQMVVVDRGAE